MKTKGLLRSSKQKQKLFKNFVKKTSLRNESIYIAYESLSESLKKNSFNKKHITQDVL